MKLHDFDYLYKFIENEIEEGVCLVEGVKPTIAELLEFHLTANDENFLTWMFNPLYDVRDIDSLADLTEDELEQIEKLRKYCAD